MGATITTMTAALKKLYLPRIRSTMQTKTVLRSRLQSNTESTDSSGLSAIVPVNIRGNQAGIGARAEGGALPTAGNQTYIESKVSYAFNYGVISVSHPVIVSSKDDKGAWTRALSSEMTGLERDFSQDMNRQDFGYGGAFLAICTAADDGAGLLYVNSTQYIKVGQVVVAFNALSGGTQHDGDMTVTAVNSATTFTVSGASTNVANADYIFRSGARTYEPMGIRGLCDDYAITAGYGPLLQTLQNIDRSTYPEFNSNVFENADVAREVTPTFLDDCLLIIEEKGECKVSLGITSRIQFRKIANLVIPDRRYTDSQTLEGGFKAINWSGVPIVWDKDCPIDPNGNDSLFFLDEDHIQRYKLADMDWDDTDGNVLHRNAGYATYDATLFLYGNLGTDRPNAHGWIRDLSRS